MRPNLATLAPLALDLVAVVGLFVLAAIGRLDPTAAVATVVAIVAARRAGGPPPSDGTAPVVASGVVGLVALAGAGLDSALRVASARG